MFPYLPAEPGIINPLEATAPGGGGVGVSIYHRTQYMTYIEILWALHGSGSGRSAACPLSLFAQ